VYVEGSLRSRKWQDREGTERTSFEVVASQMVMLGSKAGKQSASNGADGSGHAADRSTPESEIGGEEIPF
jgi:single-strand DNA-binding protein